MGQIKRTEIDLDNSDKDENKGTLHSKSNLRDDQVQKSIKRGKYGF